MLVFSILRKTISVLLAAILMIGVRSPRAVYTVTDEDTCLTNFTVISDVHMEGNNKISRDAFIRELYDIRSNAFGNDALVLLGDNTMNGQHIENMFLFGLLDRIDPADRLLLTLGNHDTGNGEGRYDLLVNRYYSYYNTFCGLDVQRPYYSDQVNGYDFIFLGSEEDDINSPVISDAQLLWLDDQLAEATADGEPVFVFAHHPYENFEDPSALLDVLTDYDNIFFFTGHTHRYDILQENLSDGVHYFNLPRVTELNEDGETFDVTGQGLNVEIYEDQIVIRERNFFTGEWMDSYEFPLV